MDLLVLAKEPVPGRVRTRLCPPLGQRLHTPGIFAGVPMSVPDPGRARWAALEAYGLRVAPAPTLRDLDRVEDLGPVAASAPGTRVASVVADLTERLR